MRPFFGYHMPNYTFAGVADTDLFDHVVELAQAAEAAGFDMVTVMDHFYQIGPVGPEEEPMLEAYTTLGALLVTAFKKNRDVRRAAPWNTAIYLDLNVDLIRRDLPVAAVARKEFIPRQPGLFKTPDFYYTLARKIENHSFDAELAVRLAGQKIDLPASQAPKA